MTNQNDLRIAEAVGYTLWRFKEQPELFECWHSDEFDPATYPEAYEPATPNDVGKDDVVERCPPFDSAPSWESDGVILEWVQGQKEDVRLQFEFHYRVREIAMSRVGEIPHDWGVAFIQLFEYKPGDYAQAVLEASGE